MKSPLTAAPSPWLVVDVLVSVDSTNLEAMRVPLAWRVVVADHQSEGRGRLARQWLAPAGTSIAVSATVPMPAGRAEDLGWLPLLSGMAMRTALSDVAHVVGRLKWPNDVMVQERATNSDNDDVRVDGDPRADGDSRVSGVDGMDGGHGRDGGDGMGRGSDLDSDPAWLKIAGILCEMAASGALVVIGAGANVAQRRSELPVSTATSLTLCGAPNVRREDLVVRYLAELASLYRVWSDGGAGLRSLQAEYRSWCLTIGLEVDVHQPDGVIARGRATEVDDTGRLVVAAGGFSKAHAAGDVVHVRPAPRHAP